jgi:hypothetical protein
MKHHRKARQWQGWGILNKDKDKDKDEDEDEEK